VTDRQRFRITFDALPGNEPPTIRLRQALKNLLRAWRLKCVSVEELAPGRGARGPVHRPDRFGRRADLRRAITTEANDVNDVRALRQRIGETRRSADAIGLALSVVENVGEHGRRLVPERTVKRMVLQTERVVSLLDSVSEVLSEHVDPAELVMMNGHDTSKRTRRNKP
jgi:hypothetical protein